jgi:hypothetical protein
MGIRIAPDMLFAGNILRSDTTERLYFAECGLTDPTDAKALWAYEYGECETFV